MKTSPAMTPEELSRIQAELRAEDALITLRFTKGELIALLDLIGPRQGRMHSTAADRISAVKTLSSVASERRI
jgi:hypothetical protein